MNLDNVILYKIIFLALPVLAILIYQIIKIFKIENKQTYPVPFAKQDKKINGKRRYRK